MMIMVFPSLLNYLAVGIDFDNMLSSGEGAMSSKNKKAPVQQKPKPLLIGGLGSSNSGSKQKGVKGRKQDDDDDDDGHPGAAQDESFEDKISS